VGEISVAKMIKSSLITREKIKEADIFYANFHLKESQAAELIALM